MSQMNRRDILDVIRDLTIKNWAPYFILGRNIETVTVEAWEKKPPRFMKDIGTWIASQENEYFL
jgi:hypothetical protein